MDPAQFYATSDRALRKLLESHDWMQIRGMGTERWVAPDGDPSEDYLWFHTALGSPAWERHVRTWIIRIQRRSHVRLTQLELIAELNGYES